jgi:ubiquinone/menaquinone biosynthesis C-methylase UbiE
MKAYTPREYWRGVAADFRSADASGLAPVLHPGAPDWFNRLIDHLQFRAIRRALALAEVQRGARILDVGCGTGRWLRRYQQLGLAPTGVDATPGMLAVALEQGTRAPVVSGDARALPFADSEFDCVSDITVVQHIPRAQQPQALGEMVRVLKPGGRLILLELIRGEDAHIFPRSSRDWIQQVESFGAKAIGSFGQEYLLLDRMFVSAARALTERNGTEASAPTPGSSAHSSTARVIYWGIRRLIAPVSIFTDPLAERICPASLATHNVFIFQK